MSVIDDFYQDVRSGNMPKPGEVTVSEAPEAPETPVSTVSEASQVAPEPSEALHDGSRWLPSRWELAALSAFASTDETRPSLATVWHVRSPEGSLYIATDGHTMAVRRAGTFRDTPIGNFAQVKHAPILSDIAKGGIEPAPWWAVLKVGTVTKGAQPPVRGIDCSYLARVGVVEKQARRRIADDWTPADEKRPNMTKKEQADMRSYLRAKGCFASVVIPTDELGGWYFKIATPQALWEMIVMPRRP